MRRLSELAGNSQSGLIAELLEANEATFARLITVLEAAHTAKDALTTEMSAGLEKAQGKMEQQLGLVLEALDEGVAPILDAAEKVTRRAPRKAARGPRAAGAAAARKGAARKVQTPLSNRGVRSTPDKPKTRAKTRT